MKRISLILCAGFLSVLSAFAVDYDQILMENMNSMPAAQQAAPETGTIVNPYQAPVQQQMQPETKAVQAPKTSAKPAEKDTVVVTARQVPETLGTVPRTVDIIDTSKIMDAATFVDATRGITSLKINRYGPYQGLATVSLRGSSSRQTLVMLDGIQVNDIFTGNTDMSLIDVYGTEKIEIVKGGLSSVYGADASAGAVNIITQKNTGKWLTGYASYGSNYSQRLQAGSSQKIFNVEYTVNVSEDKSPGFTANSDYLKRSARGSASFASERSDTTLSGYYVNREAGSPFNQFGPTVKARQADEQYGYGLTEYIDFDIITLKLDSASRGGNLGFENEEYSIKDKHNKGEVKSSVTVLYEEANLIQAAAGYEYKSDDVDSTKAGKKQLSNNAEFVNATLKLPFGIFASGGYRADTHSVYGRMDSWSAGLKTKLPQGLDAYVSAERSFAAPTVGELYWTESIDYFGFYLSETFGNTSLKPETSFSYEAGISKKSSGFEQSIVVFRRDTKDQIAWKTETDDYMTYDRTYPVNINRSQTTGIEFKLNATVMNGLSAEIAYTYLDSRDMATGKKAAYSPEDTINAALTWDMTAGVRLKAEGQYVDARRDTAGIYMKEYYLLNLSAEQTLAKDTKITVSAENMLDNKEYMIINKYPMQGRLLRAGISTAF